MARLGPLQVLGQIAAYALFAAVIGYFSLAPAYTHLDPGLALVKLSFSHAARLKGECRRLTPEELAKLPPNMRRPLDCPRERLPVVVELALDGRPLYRAELPPGGLARDGTATVYRRFAVEPGRHVLAARLRDSARAEGFDYERTAEIELRAGQNLAVDFHADRGGFVFK